MPLKPLLGVCGIEVSGIAVAVRGPVLWGVSRCLRRRVLHQHPEQTGSSDGEVRVASSLFVYVAVRGIRRKWVASHVRFRRGVGFVGRPEVLGTVSKR